MKLINLNIESDQHYHLVLPFIDAERPEILCIQEALEDFADLLKNRGYQTAFLPTTIKPSNDGSFSKQGVLLASLHSIENLDLVYNYTPPQGIVTFNKGDTRNTIAQGFIFGTIKNLNIVATHFTWTKRGEIASEDQKQDCKKLLKLLSVYPPHLLCGDFNIPRGYNHLYENLIEHYSDEIPKAYASSLDRSLHRLGSSPDHQHMFSDFMVDYIFKKRGYNATVNEVRLQFDLSDHAAVVAEITSAD